MMFVNLCTVNAAVGAGGANVLLAGLIYGFTHNWSRNGTRALYAKNSVLLVPREEVQMMTYW